MLRISGLCEKARARIRIGVIVEPECRIFIFSGYNETIRYAACLSLGLLFPIALPLSARLEVSFRWIAVFRSIRHSGRAQRGANALNQQAAKALPSDKIDRSSAGFSC